MKYGWKYVFEPTPKNVSKWLLALRAVFGVAQAAAVIDHASVATQLSIIVIGATLHELGSLIGDESNSGPTV
jgi:hypothetical protein